MAYSNSNADAEFRPELHAVVESAMAADTKFIADLIFPITPVETDTGDYMRIKRGAGQLLSKPGATTDALDPLVRAPGTAYREVTRAEEKDSWKCIDRGLSEPIDDKVKQKLSRFYDKEAAASRLLMRSMRISREARVAAKLFNETNFPNPVTSPLAFTDANRATFDFPELLKEAKRTVEKRQEDGLLTLVLSGEMWDLVQGSTLLRQYFFGTAGGSAGITRQMVAEKFELDQILVGKSSYDTTKVGKTASDSTLVWTWGNDYFAVCGVVGGAPELGGLGRTFTLEQMTSGQLFVTESFREQKIRSTTIVVREDNDTKVVNENSAVLVKINSL